MVIPAGDKATRIIRQRYDLFAPVYDFVDNLAEASFNKWRALLWSKTEGQNILEMGVGTGKNIPYYPAGARVTALDLSEKMLSRARRKAASLKREVDLRQMDVQRLEFADNTFDSVAASFVFCTVPDPVMGLKEAGRVTKPGGKVVLLEHVLSSNPFTAWWMNRLNPLASLLIDNINRKTIENVKQSGLIIEQVTDLNSIVKLIEAKKG